MLKLYLLTAIAILVFPSIGTFAQTATPAPDDVVKISTKLVQLDAVVTDKAGNQVKELKTTDFEILQDGKPQKIVGLSYVDTDLGTRTDKEQTTAGLPVQSRAAGAGRIITFIVDDGNCSTSFSGMNAAREALQKFVREQMLPNDRVAIYRTRAGSSMLQQYISDKERLLRLIGKVRWLPAMGSCSNSDGSMFEAAKASTLPVQSVLGAKSVSTETDAERQRRESTEDRVNDNQVVGTIGVINYVVRGLQPVPGRRIVFLLSDGLPVRSRSGEMLSAVDVLGDLSELANRSSVVFNTIDVRGVVNTDAIEARDEVYVQADPASADKIAESRHNLLFTTQDGLAYLAAATGGKFYHDSNFLDYPIKKALSTEKGYYLLAYEPDNDTFKGKKFHQISIRVLVPGLSARSRPGFQGIAEEIAKTRKKTEYSDLYQAIAAPLPRAGLDLRLTAFFVNTSDTGNVVRSLINVSGEGLTFVDEPGGLKKTVIDVVAVTLNEKNQVIDEFTRTHVFKVGAAALPYIRANGLVYATDVPIKKTGTYNFRVAVRDTASASIGSATQIIDIPDVDKRRLTLAGLTLAEVDQKGSFASPGATKLENALSVPMSGAVPAIRRFRRGSVLAYAYTAYGAQLDASGSAKATVVVNLYKDGELAIKGTAQPAQFENQPDWTRIKDFGYLRLRPEMAPGDYVLQIAVKDELSGKTSTQSVDFEVTE
jgi:VWFA-related protein